MLSASDIVGQMFGHLGPWRILCHWCWPDFFFLTLPLPLWSMQVPPARPIKATAGMDFSTGLLYGLRRWNIRSPLNSHKALYVDAFISLIQPSIQGALPSESAGPMTPPPGLLLASTCSVLGVAKTGAISGTASCWGIAGTFCVLTVWQYFSSLSTNQLPGCVCVWRIATGAFPWNASTVGLLKGGGNSENWLQFPQHCGHISLSCWNCLESGQTGKQVLHSAVPAPHFSAASSLFSLQIMQIRWHFLLPLPPGEAQCPDKTLDGNFLLEEFA